MEPRNYAVQLVYNNVQATESITPYLSSFTYTDTVDESDTVSINLIDREGKWASGWMPQKEDLLRPEIQMKNWKKSGDQWSIICGDFMVDDFSFSGPPDMLTINGISSPVNMDFKEMARSQTWKDVTLKQIATEICGRYALQLIFDGEDVPIKKMEQSRQTDADFIKKLAEKYGYAMKTYANRLVLFERDVYEERPAAWSVKKAEIRKWTYKSTMLGTYTGAKVSYTVPKTKKTVEITVGKEGRLYNTTEKADSPADAERIGKNAIRNANRKETTITFTIVPPVMFHVGNNIFLQGFGKLNGTYQVDKITHQLGKSDYAVQVNAWKIRDEETEEKSAAEEPVNAQTNETRYIVQPNDTLWSLAVKFYGDGTKYKDIYEANKEIMDQEAKKHGKSNSASGYWLWPGNELIIP